MPDVYARTLRRAAQIVGGVNELASRLSVTNDDLVLWLTARTAVPPEIFLRAVDIVVAHDLDQVSNEPTIEIPPPGKPDPEPGRPAVDVSDDEPTIELAPPRKPGSLPSKPD